jgi:lipase
VTLALHEWRDPGLPRIVCLHGVRNHGRHFAPLATRLTGYHVLAPDLLGHGHSPWEPPWDIATHLDAIVETSDARESILIGHSFGGRLAFELAARAPKLVPKLVLLDPVVVIPGHVALAAAENARLDKSYVSFDELIERRYDESQLHFAPRELVVEDLASHVETGDDGRVRYRYCQSAVVAAYGEMASTPPRFEDVRVLTSPADQGVTLRWQLTPVRRIARITVTGNPVLPASGIRSELADRYGALPSANRADDMVTTLKAYYAARGFPVATIRPPDARTTRPLPARHTIPRRGPKAQG